MNTHEPLRGEETSLGQAGFCLRCRRSMPDGPDVCIGELPDVAFACCGHGVTRRAYVAFGEPGAVVEVIRGPLALSYMGLPVVEVQPPLPRCQLRPQGASSSVPSGGCGGRS